MDYAKEVRQVLNEEIDNLVQKKLETIKCPDITAGKNGVFWFSKEEREKKRKNDLRIKTDGSETQEEVCIVIVLESPHIEEFKKFKLKSGTDISASPAMGETGGALQELFTQEFVENIFEKNNGIDINKSYKVILMNSIQFQCSCGINTKIIRDHMWLKLWFGENNLKEDFEKRIKSYNPDIIFNFCTRGDHQLEIYIPDGCKKVINNKYICYCLGKDY